jgi:hypothetical protein
MRGSSCDGIRRLLASKGLPFNGACPFFPASPAGGAGRVAGTVKREIPFIVVIPQDISCSNLYSHFGKNQEKKTILRLQNVCSSGPLNIISK